MSHAYTDDPDAPGFCRICFLPRANKRHLGGVAVPFDGAAWPTPGAPELSESERIMDAIRETASLFREFSANDVRPRIKGGIANTHKVGSAFKTLIEGKEITKLRRDVASDEPRTHSHPICVYRAGPRLQKPKGARV